MFTTLMVLRRRAGMTQTELANAVGLHQGEVSLAESGKRVRRLDLVALFFDVADPDDLLLDWDTYRDKQEGRQPVAV
jgi:transcriptional regulator with XRE-family HTH domain